MNLSSLDPTVLGQPTMLLTIGDAALKATLLLSLAGLVAAALRRATAAARHMVWTLGLIGALLVPLLALAVPRWPLPIITLAPAVPTATSALSQPNTLPNQDSAAPAGSTARRDTRANPSSAASPAPQLEGSPSSWLSTFSWTAALFTLWLAGLLAIAGRLGIGMIAVQWMSRSTERVTDAPWLPLARQLAAEVGVSSRLTFLRSPRATMPMAWGLVKPSVLMPADADAWPASRLRIVLLHELAHVRRRDCLTHAVAQLACAVHWFNPLVWAAVRRARAERERACDDLVLTAGTGGPEYADQLLEIARVMRDGRFPVLVAGATLAMAHRSQLEGRLIAILDPKVPRSRVSRLRAAGATLTAACAVVPLAVVQPWTYAAASAPVSQTASPVTIAAQTPAPDTASPAPTPEPGPALRAPVPVDAAEVADAVAQGPAQGLLEGIAQGAVQGVRGGQEVQGVQGVQELQGRQEGARQKADPKMVAALTAALKDTDKEVREAAMHALVQLRDPAIFEPLVAALGDTSADVREEAASGLAQLRDRRAVEPLVGALKDASPKVREQAAFALGQLRDPASVDALVAALKDQNPSVREQVAFALGQIRDKRATAALAGAITDSNADVREQAVFALGQIRDASAIDGLMTALRDANPDVREQAAFALGQIRDRRAVEPLISALKDTDADVREQAAFGLGQIRDRSAVEALVLALKDSDADVREQVAFALGQIRDPRAIDALTDALKDPDASVRQQAAFALGQLAR